MTAKTHTRGDVKRRRFLQGIAVTTAASLAGCGSNDGGDGGDGNGGGGGGGGGGGDGNGGGGDGGDGNSQDLGERVPPVVGTWWSDINPQGSVFQKIIPIFGDSLAAVGDGIPFEPRETAVLPALDEVYNDKRECHLWFNGSGQSPDRLDPHIMTRRFAIDWAGANGKASVNNYASCEYTGPALGQAKAATPEERRDLVYEAHSISSNDVTMLPFTTYPIFGAIRTDLVEPGGVGKAGLKKTNPYLSIYSEPKGGDVVLEAAPVTDTESQNPYTSTSSTSIYRWNHIPHSSLVEYDENFELNNLLAESLEVADGGTRYVVELRDATFHNGDPITAEDVKFTFEMLANHPGGYPLADEPPYTDEGIVVVDEKTVEFNLTEPFPPLRTKEFAKWGIVHRETWEAGGANDSPESFDFSQNPIGSGPFRIRRFEVGGSSIAFEPHDGHPVHDPAHELVWRTFNQETTQVQAFNAGEINLMPSISSGAFEQVRKQHGDEMVFASDGIFPYQAYPQCDHGPTKFREFRLALGKAVDRQKMIDVAFFGLPSPSLYDCQLEPAHPFRPPDDMLTQMTDRPEGDPAGARQLLEEAGWGWDGNGNLRYPADADLSPLWPDGEEPVDHPDEFPCVGDL